MVTIEDDGFNERDMAYWTHQIRIVLGRIFEDS